MLIQMKLLSYERYVEVHDGTQKLTLAHGQVMDISAPGGKITIVGASDERPPTEVKQNVEATDSVDTVSGNVTRTRTSRRVGGSKDDE